MVKGLWKVSLRVCEERYNEVYPPTFKCVLCAHSREAVPRRVTEEWERRTIQADVSGFARVRMRGLHYSYSDSTCTERSGS